MMWIPVLPFLPILGQNGWLHSRWPWKYSFWLPNFSSFWSWLFQRNEWMTLLLLATWFQGCFRQNITVVTIYASLGDDAVIHSLNEVNIVNKWIAKGKTLSFIYLSNILIVIFFFLLSIFYYICLLCLFFQNSVGHNGFDIEYNFLSLIFDRLKCQPWFVNLSNWRSWLP